MLSSARQFLQRQIERFLANPLLQRVIRNSGYLFSAKTGSAALSFAQSALAARMIGMVQFGLLGAITQFAGLLNRLLSFRMSQLVISYVGEFEAKGENERAAAVFLVSSVVETISSVVAYLLVLLLAPVAAAILTPDQDLAGMFALYGLMLLANLMAESASGLLQVADRYRLIAAITLGQTVLTLGLIVAFYLTGGGLREVVIAYLLGKVVWALAISGAAIREAFDRWGPGWWRSPVSSIAHRWREMARFAFSTNLTTTLTLITRDSEMLWLNALSTPLQAGYYKVALAFTNVLLIPVDPLINTTYREVAREVAAKRWQNVTYLLRSGSLISAAWTLPAAVLLAVFGRLIIRLTYGLESIPAYDSLLILLLGVAVVNIFYWNRNVLLPLGKPSYPTKVYLVGTVLRVIAILALVPDLGAIGMAILLSAFFAGTAAVLVLKTMAEIRQARTALTEA